MKRKIISDRIYSMFYHTTCYSVVTNIISYIDQNLAQYLRMVYVPKDINLETNKYNE